MMGEAIKFGRSQIKFPDPISSLDVGASLFLTLGGKLTEFIIVHQGIPSTLYDDSCNGTWLLMKDIYENRAWHSSNANAYDSSTIHSYLNSTFLGLFDSQTQNAIKSVKIPYGIGLAASSANSGANGLSAKIFLLGGYEVGWTSSVPADGALLKYFSTGDSSTDRAKRIAYLNGTAADWWLRSPRTGVSNSAYEVAINGSCGAVWVTNSYGIRPALILPSGLYHTDGIVKV